MSASERQTCAPPSNLPMGAELSGTHIRSREPIAMNKGEAIRSIESDPYLRPAFTFWNKLTRAIWNLAWLILFRPTPTPLFWWRSTVLRAFGARIGRQNFIYPSARIWAPWLLETEAVVTIGRGVEIYNPGGVVLKHHSIISQNACLCGASHDYNDPEFPFVSKPISMEPYSWVCARAIVLPGVTLGEGSILGAGSVTARSLEPWWIYAGNPARRSKPRRQQELPQEQIET